MKRVHDDVVHYMRVRFFWTFLIWAFAALLASAAAFYFELSHWVYWGASPWLTLLFIIGIIVRPLVYCRVTRYRLKTDHIIVRKGFFRVSTKMVPVRRIQGAKLSTGPVSRKYDLALLEVSTASSRLLMPPLKIEEAAILKEEVIELVKGEHTDV